jgi:hypothetical protein
MRLWKAFLIAMSTTILPLALVGVGQAQEMTCWGLAPVQAGLTGNISVSEQGSGHEGDDAEICTDNACGHMKSADYPQETRSSIQSVLAD